MSDQTYYENISCRKDNFSAKSHIQYQNLLKVLYTHDLNEVQSTICSMEEFAKEHKCYVAGFVSYEAAPGLNNNLITKDPDPAVPLVWFAAFSKQIEVPFNFKSDCELPQNLIGDFEMEEYERKIAQIKEEILSGNTYQVNFTSRLKCSVEVSPITIYELLATNQKGDYSTLIDTDKFSVISASPELFFKIENNLIVSKPMKGTMRRAKSYQEDEKTRLSLLSSDKDISENLMIVDLIRNDLGMISDIGTVKVPSHFVAEKYPTVWQMTSTVEGKLKSQTSICDIFQAIFPCGSVTGVPKVSTMKIIATTEKSTRGVYCGAVGCFDYTQRSLRAEFSVAIRTGFLNKLENCLYFGTGGGIVHQSDSKAEWAELQAKAQIMRKYNFPHALLETMYFSPKSGIKNFERHLNRLSDSAQYFDFNFDLDKIRSECFKVFKGELRELRIRLILFNNATFDIQTFPFVANKTDGILLGLSQIGVNSEDISLYHKYEDRAFYENCRNNSKSYDDVILWNENGHITETTTANIAIFKEDRWITPSLSCGLLPGVERAVLIDDRKIQEGLIDIKELTSQTKCIVFNSLRGIREAKILV